MELTNEDLHNLTDLIYMIDDKLFDTIKLNGMEDWLIQFQNRVEQITLKDTQEGKNE